MITFEKTKNISLDRLELMLKRIKNLTLTLLLLFLIFGHSEIQGQCSCILFLPQHIWLDKEVDYIFAGKVTKVTDKKYPPEYEVQVTENFRGTETGKTVKIFKGGCNNQRAENKEYLFIVSKSKNKLVEKGCSYSYESIYQQEQALEYFRLIKNSNKQTAIIVGKVATGVDEQYNTRKPDEVDKIFAENEKGEIFETIIEPNGIYRFTGLKPGKYRVFLNLPETLIANIGLLGYAERSSVNIEISPEKGDVVDFSVSTNGIISGRLIDENGMPVASLDVNLYYLGETGKEILVDTKESDDSGNFIFKGLSPGKYFIKTGPYDSFTMDLKNLEFPITYYPNANNRANAEIIELGQAQTVGSKNIVLNRLNKRLIGIQVLMPDGSAAKNASLSYHFRRQNDGRKLRGGGFGIGTTDSKGRFSFDAFENTDYFIEAYIQERISENTIKIQFSGCVIVNDKEKIRETKIILEKDNKKCDFRDYGFYN